MKLETNRVQQYSAIIESETVIPSTGTSLINDAEYDFECEREPEVFFKRVFDGEFERFTWKKGVKSCQFMQDYRASVIFIKGEIAEFFFRRFPEYVSKATKIEISEAEKSSFSNYFLVGIENAWLADELIDFAQSKFIELDHFDFVDAVHSGHKDPSHCINLENLAAKKLSFRDQNEFSEYHEKHQFDFTVLIEKIFLNSVKVPPMFSWNKILYLNKSIVDYSHGKKNVGFKPYSYEISVSNPTVQN